jgi:predicted RNA-binding Zn-ribbon protein involved in translation (DUF1610 family)
MSDNQPQNPVFSVGADALQACMAKVACPSCGTIIPLRPRKESFLKRCSRCGARLRISEAGMGWSVTFATEQRRGE